MVPKRKSPTGKVRAYYFKSEKEAKTFCREVKDGRLAPEPITRTEQEEFGLAVKRFSSLFGGNVGELYEVASKIKELQNLKPATVREAVERYYEYRLNLPNLAKDTAGDDKSRLAPLVRSYGELRMSDLNEKFVVDWIFARGGCTRSIYKTVKPFLKWSVKERYLQDNPLGQVEPKIFGSFGVHNEYYPVPVFRRMLRIAAGLEPINPGEAPTRAFVDLLGPMVVGGFAGLRSVELVRESKNSEAIRWTDLYFSGVDHPNLWVRKEVAKKTRRKAGDARPVNFPYALEALQAWLPLVPRYNGNPFIAPWTEGKIYRLKVAFEQATGIEFIDNGLRNSFGTYAFSYSGDSALGQVAKQMGTSEAIARRHYVQNLPSGTGQSWFGLRPFEIIGKEVVA